MKNTQTSAASWIERATNLGAEFETRATRHDKEGTFVSENYDQLKKDKFFSAAIPVELGGGGLSHAEMCDVIRTIGRYCGSTALAYSMHQHLIAAAVWKYRNKNEGAEMLQKVATNELVLVSTGARDWLGSNGEMKKVDGGYLFSAKKHFASQSVYGNIAVTSAPYQTPDNEWKVLHFGVPLKAEGVSIADDWDVMGMRGTGSQTIIFDNVMIADSAITLERPRDEFHMIWDLVLTVAVPLIMSAYVGIAEKAANIALEKGKKYIRNQQFLPFMIGKMHNSLLSAQTQLFALQTLANNFDFKPSQDITIDVLSYKTNIGNETKKVVEIAMEALGGQSFYRSNQLERLFRDVQASPFHPLPEMEQYLFTGERIIAG